LDPESNGSKARKPVHPPPNLEDPKPPKTNDLPLDMTPMEDVLMQQEHEEEACQETKDMELEGIHLYGIVEACQRRNITSIPHEHI